MADNEASVMIALLPTETEWCKIDYPHMTLVYAGAVKDLPASAFNELAKDASSLSMLTRRLTLQVTAREMFGNWSDKPEDAVDVFRLRSTPELQSMRNFVERWNASEWPFNPHVTIGPPGVFVEVPPRYLSFDKISVGWGQEYITFSLNG